MKDLFMLSKETVTYLIGAFTANGIELNKAGLAVIEAALSDYDDALVKQAITNVLKSGNRMGLAEINKQFAEMTQAPTTSPAALVDRCIKLLRHPQRDGSTRAQAEDPEAYAVLTTVGRWYDIHNRSEHDLRGLRLDLKDAARTHLQGLKQGQQALPMGQEKQTPYLESKIESWG